MPRRVYTHAAVLLGYAAISFAYFGWRLVEHPGRKLIGAKDQSDAEIFVWSFAWWPHAIGAWTNPFVTHAVYAPTGINLTWVTSVPGLALAFAPLTVLFGPSVSFNVAAVVLPALSAFAAYLLCRYAAGSLWAGLVGGYLYGFSSYVLAHQFASHLNLTAAFLIPLAALALLRFVRGDLGGGGLAWRLGVIVALQAYISTEVGVTLTLMLFGGLGLAWLIVREARPRIAASLKPVGLGYALAAVLAAPLIYFALTGFVTDAIGYADLFDADLLNVVIPTQVTGPGRGWFHSLSSQFPGDVAERGSYLGIPALLIVVLLVLRRPRKRVTWFLLAAFAIATLLSLGQGLHVAGDHVAWLPWSIPAKASILRNIIPARFALYATLAVAVMVALWIGTTRGRFFRRPVVLPLLAVALLVPPVWAADSIHHPERWGFFSDGLYKICIPKNENLMVFPFGRYGGSLLWQAESDFWFRMPEGTLAHNDQPRPYADDPTINALVFRPESIGEWPTMSELRALARRRHVDRIASVDFYAYPSGTQMHDFGPVQLLGGVLVAPACGYPSLQAKAKK